MRNPSFVLVLVLVSSALLSSTCGVQASPNSPTVYIKILRIQRVDPIETFLEGEADWRYILKVWDGKTWFIVNATAEPNKDDVTVNVTHTLSVASSTISIYMALIEDDVYTSSDLADISSSPDGGVNNWRGGEVPRGAEYQGTYDLKRNTLTGDQVVTEGGYYRTSGDFDGSASVDEYDADLWFKAWDNYDVPIADAGPNQTVKTGEKVNFDGSNSLASEGSTIFRCEWDFESDGITDAEGAKTSYTYSRKGNYTVTLRVTDDIGEAVTDRCIVTVQNRLPSASFTYSPLTPTIRDTVVFYDTSTDLDGSIVSWYWEFGDGTNSSDRNPTHKYQAKGSYSVKLVATDNDGDPDSTIKKVTVANLTPTASFTYSPPNPIENNYVQFTDASSDPEGKIASWNWDFGDGQKSTEKNPTHAYTKAGGYTVTLKVVDDEGASSTKPVSIDIQAQPFWTQTWFYALVVALVALVVVASALSRSRRKPRI